jgi:hypothetical protein
VVLSACGKEPEVNVRNASVEEVADQVAEASREGLMMRPGQWTSKATIEEVTIPGMPPEVAARMKKMVVENQPEAFESCLTAEQARKPKEDFFAGAADGCRYDHFKMGGGKIDAKMQCGRKGATQTMEMAGTYSPDSYSMTMRMGQADIEGPAEAVKMRMRVDARRTGECKPAKA